MNVVHKTIASSDGVEFVLSDDSVDRYGDVIDQSGWDLRNFKKNPVALFGHSSHFPIGNWTNIRVEGNKLIAKLNFAAKGTSQRIDEIISLVEQGILRAVSVGFRPLKYEPLDKEKPYGGQRYTKQELLETSLVSIPANPAALSLAKSLNLSPETLSLVFGEQAVTRSFEEDHRQESRKPKNDGSTKPMTLSQRIEAAKTALVAMRDKLVELTNATDLDVDAIDEQNLQIETAEKQLKAMEASERKLAGHTGREDETETVTPKKKDGTVPAQPRRPLGVGGGNPLKGMDLMVKAITARGVAHFSGISIDQALEQRYSGQEAVGVIAKADQTIGTTTVSGWASELVQTTYADFLQALTGFSIYPVLRDRGIGLSFDGNGTVSIPSRTAGGAHGSFVGEGSPIRVGRTTTAATTMTPHKMGVIVPFSRELARRSTPSIEALVRQAILEDTASTLDPLLLDAVAGSAIRPAGLLDGVSAVGSGYGGGDYEAVIADFTALLAPFISANAADNITVIMNPAQGLKLALMPAPPNNPGWFNAIRERVSIVESTHATANRLIAVRTSDFATATGDAPEFDVSEQATIHMEDTTPLEIVSGTGPTTADPVRSLWQTASVGIRMLMQISWKMRRTGMVQWVDTTTW